MLKEEDTLFDEICGGVDETPSGDVDETPSGDDEISGNTDADTDTSETCKSKEVIYESELKEVQMLMKKCDPKLVYVAIHECGHAIAAKVLGMSIFCVQISTTRKWQAHGSAYFDHHAGHPLLIQTTMIATAAGEAATRYAFPSLDTDYNSSNDNNSNLRDAVKIHGLIAGDDVIADEVGRANRRANRLVDMYWEKIIEAATFMLKHHEIFEDIGESVSPEIFDERTKGK